MGANVPGKARAFLPYCAGVDFYRAGCDDVVARGYLGFSLSGPNGSQCNDGVVRRLQPDAEMVLMEMAAMNLPLMESMSVPEARAFYTELSATRPPGPDVGEIVDGVLPGAEGPWRIGSTGRRRLARTRSSCTSTAGVGLSATLFRMIRCAVICACEAMPSLSRRTTVTRPSTDSPRRLTMRWPRCVGSPTTPRCSEANRANSRCVAGAQAVGSQRWSASSRETWADHTSSGRRC